jgi:hypothetical protein
MSAIYVFWNAMWLLQGSMAPSLFTAFTGLPCPTTGGTRAMHCLLAGDVAGSVLYNPFTLPILGLFAASLAWLLVRWARGRRAVLPTALAWSWLVLLGAAWVCKLLSPRSHW